MPSLYTSGLTGVEIDVEQTDKLAIGQLIEQLKTITGDHETRIRFLERVIGYGVGALGAVKLLMDYVVKSQGAL